MNINNLLEILKYILPSLVVLAACYMIVNKFIVAETQRKQLELMHDTQDVTVRLRLQAYERLVLLIERMHPRQLIPRVYEPGMTARDLQQSLIFNINTEFEHNLSQQLYVSPQVWGTVRNVKEQQLNMINHIAQQMNAEASAKDLHMRIVEFVLTSENQVPGETALQLINEEAKRVLSYGTLG